MKFVLCSLMLVGLVGAAWAQEAPENMVLVPAGEFTMGTDSRDGTDFNARDNTPLSNNDARPRHSARTGAFWIDKTEVTNSQYKVFCEATKLATPPDWKGGQIPEGQIDFPVRRVTWFEASAYAKWAGKRLPSETEWEKAARGTDGRNYPWGDNWDGSRVVWDNGPRAVGSVPGGASPYGALDMAGNVCEWTTSWWEGYANAPTKQTGFGEKIFKVVRGGAWYGGNSQAQTWFREVFRPNQRSIWVGFRCVRDAPATATR